MIFDSRPRRGTSLIELLVAATLLLSGITVVTQLTVAAGRMWQQTRHERLAMEELSNQLEYLIALEPDQRATALQALAPSPLAVEVLPEVNLTADAIADQDGSRLELSLVWGGRPKPITLVGWIGPAESTETTDSTETAP